MKSIFEDYPLIIFIAAVIIVFCGYTTISMISSENDNNDSYISAVEHNSDYDIYLDGEKKDNSSFKISSLDKNKYSFKVDYENKEISINTYRTSSNRGTSFIPMPIFSH